MLSVKVVCALQILKELSIQKKISPRIGLNVAELKKRGTVKPSIYPKVLVKLREKKYISQIGNSYKLIISLEEVSLEDLITLFHGGICIGEVFDDLLGKNYSEVENYKEIARTEKNIKNEFARYLKKVNLAGMFSPTLQTSE